MKIGFFADSHYTEKKVDDEFDRSRSAEKIRNAYSFFKKENCDLAVCMGDLIDDDVTHQKEIENLKVLSKIIKDSEIPTVCLTGNHDCFEFDSDEFYEVLGLRRPETMVFNDKTFVFIDACFTKKGKHYEPGDSDWTDTYFPHIDKLKAEIEKADGDVYVFVHQSLDLNVEEHHILFNAEEINALLADSGKVKAVFQGHYHPGMKSVHSNIDYITFPAMFSHEDAFYVLEI